MAKMIGRAEIASVWMKFMGGVDFSRQGHSSPNGASEP
jgi:hypothetical protein